MNAKTKHDSIALFVKADSFFNANNSLIDNCFVNPVKPPCGLGKEFKEGFHLGSDWGAKMVKHYAIVIQFLPFLAVLSFFQIKNFVEPEEM